MAYTRFFLPLESEATGYDFKGRTPAGRAIVESRDDEGKLTVRVQDIRAETRYGVYLIFGDGGRFAGVFAGNLNSDAKGKAEIRKDIDAASLGKFSLDAIMGVAVISDTSTPVISPLCGYRERAVSWRGAFYIFETKPAEEVSLTQVSMTPVSTREPEIEEPQEIQAPQEAPPEEEKIEEKVFEPETEIPVESSEEIPMEIPVESLAEIPVEIPVEPLAEIPEEIPIEAAAEIPVEIPPEAPAKTSRPRQTAPRARKPKSTKSARAETLQAIEAVFNAKPPETPFESQENETRWVKLTIFDAVPLPHNRPLLLEEPFIRAAYANYGHLLLGLAADGAQYIIGVPGEYAADLRPQAKRLGFSKFKTNAGETPKRGDFGYWLMFADM